MDNQNTKNGFKGWLSRHKPSKRRLIQIYAALLYNANLKGFSTGDIYTGDTKKFCVPGLNCYSCPGAVGACPLGSLQNALASSSTSSVAYVFGIFVLLGLLLGRAICGFLCPFGLIQELLHKIPSPKLKKNKVTKVFSYFKYVILGIFVVMIPLAFSTKLPVPGFCKYICPDGTLIGAIAMLINPSKSDMFAMLGPLFTWKFCLLVVFLVASVFIFRFFCRFFCPLGAIYGFFCKVALLGVKLDKEKCVSCGKCVEQCQMDIRHVGDHECIHCGKCISVCPTKAIRWSGSKFFVADPTSGIFKNSSEEELAQVEAHNKKIEKRRKICQAVGAVLAIALLIGAFWYYWPHTHAYGQWVTVKEPSCTETGLKERTCECGEKETETIPVLEHQFENDVCTSCGLHKDSSVPPTEPSKDYGYEIGQYCPDFTLPLIGQDGNISLSDYEGKIIIINFWAEWCGSCIHELPYFNEFAADYADQVEIIAISIDSLPVLSAKPDKIQAAMDKSEKIVEDNGWTNIHFVFDATASVNGKSAFETIGHSNVALPITVVLDQEGKIIYNLAAPMTYESLLAAIAPALKSN